MESNPRVLTDNKSSPRTVKIDGYKAHPCGGTHVNQIAELKEISVRSIRKQKGELKVGYDVKE